MPTSLEPREPRQADREQADREQADREQADREQADRLSALAEALRRNDALVVVDGTDKRGAPMLRVRGPQATLDVCVGSMNYWTRGDGPIGRVNDVPGVTETITSRCIRPSSSPSSSPASPPAGGPQAGGAVA